MKKQAFYDPEKSYEENFAKGPFGAFAHPSRSSRKGEPRYQLWGKKLHTPFGIPAGPLINSAFVRAAFASGFDVCTYKTVRSQSYPCHPAPNILAVHVAGDLTIEAAQEPLVADCTFSSPLSITNSFGVPSMSPDWWQPDMAKAVAAAGEGQVLVGSFQGTKREGSSVADFIADYVRTAQLVQEAGAPILEANLSCPNEGTSELLCFDVTRVQQIAHAIKEKIGDTPLILKLAYFTDEQHLEKLVQAIGGVVQGLSVINTIAAPIVTADGSQALPGEGRLRSGVCGASIKWAGLEMVSRLAALRQKHQNSFVIIGVGGVMKVDDVTQYQDAGADCVQSATGAMWNQNLAREVWEQVRNKE